MKKKIFRTRTWWKFPANARKKMGLDGKRRKDDGLLDVGCWSTSSSLCLVTPLTAMVRASAIGTEISSTCKKNKNGKRGNKNGSKIEVEERGASGSLLSSSTRGFRVRLLVVDSKPLSDVSSLKEESHKVCTAEQV